MPRAVGHSKRALTLNSPSAGAPTAAQPAALLRCPLCSAVLPQVPQPAAQQARPAGSAGMLPAQQARQEGSPSCRDSKSSSSTPLLLLCSA